MLDISGTYVDYYQLTMAQAYFLRGQHEQHAVFDYFFRKLPFHGGYAVFAGLDDLLDILETLRFSEEDLNYLQQQNMHPEFLQYLRHFRFKGTVLAAREGDVVFPTEPIVRIEAGMLEAQLIETLLLNILNFQTLIATKARRIRDVAGDRTLIDFGLRRAQGIGGYQASRAAVIGGFDATSNVRAARDFNIPLAGTMAHSFVQSYDSELEAFRDYARIWPNNCVFLVDTWNTLESGIPNAITVAKEMEQRGERLQGIRLDSGDLSWLATQARQMLDASGLNYVRLTASNQLDEFIIKDLLDQGAPVDVFGVGTSLVTGAPDAALDGVYKLVYSNNKGRIKRSDTASKTMIPGKKLPWRLLDEKGDFFGADVITLDDEKNAEWMIDPTNPGKTMAVGHVSKEALLHPVMVEGKRTLEKQSLQNIRQFSQHRMQQLPKEYKRFRHPHIYKIGISDQVSNFWSKLLETNQRNDV